MAKYSIKHAAQNIKNLEKRVVQPAGVIPLNNKTKRETCLNEVKRIHIFLFGNTKGFTAISNKIKERYPEAKTYKGKNVEWNFGRDEIWEFLMKEEKYRDRLGKFKIDNYDELIYRTSRY